MTATTMLGHRMIRASVRIACLAGLAAGAIAALPLPGFANEQWQAYTYWGSPNVVSAKGFRKLVDEIEASSGGTLKIKFNLGGSLSIAAPNINAAVADDIVQIADDAYFQGAIPAATLLAMPFLTRNLDEMHKVVATMRPHIEAAYAKRGVTALGYYIYPPQVLWSRGQVASLADIRGKKYRVSSPEQGEFMKAFGAVPVTIGSADVPAALERGVVDGVLTASAGGVLAWKDLLKTSYRLGVNYPVAWIIVNTERFNRLSPDMQKKIRDLATTELSALTTALQADDVELTKKFGSEGIQVVSAKPEDEEEARKKMEPLWTSLSRARGQETTDLLGRIRSALSR